MTPFDVWEIVHPYISHILFGLFFGLIGYLVVRHYKKTGNAKIKYGVPLILTAIALFLFKYFESTLPVGTSILIPGVYLNSETGFPLPKIIRQIITVISGGLVPLIYEKLEKSFLIRKRESKTK